MIKKKNITIRVQKPCHEKWDKMTPNGNGRHCDSCNKTVIDFSNYTDKELANYFKSAGNVCGRYEVHQLNRPILIPSENSNSFLQRALLGTALAAGIASTTQGQIIHQTTTTTQSALPDSNKIKQNKVTTDSSHYIKGVVMDKKTQEPLAYAEVSFRGTSSLVVTDSIGCFKISVPGNMKDLKIELAIERHGYHSTTKKIGAGNHPTDLQISLQQKHPLFRRRYVMGSRF